MEDPWPGSVVRSRTAPDPATSPARSYPCARCGRPSAGARSERDASTSEWISTYVCSFHSRAETRTRREHFLRELSRNLTWSAEEFMGREGHTLVMGGVFDQEIDDPLSDPQLAEWCTRVLEICRDSDLRRRLQHEFLSPEEIDAADRYWDDF